MQPTTSNQRSPELATNEPADSLELGERLQAMRAHLEVASALARRGLSAAQRSHHDSLEQFFQRCLHDFERGELDARSLNAELESVASTAPSPREQVSAATFAPGDGANDAQVTPEGARGKPGSWPAF
ncbi:MAG TPA: hypothetical protein VJV79_39305 [Polyangiaceae bacterium]|nr:hypothetical protein [Polyangiaceae bacterium]